MRDKRWLLIVATVLCVVTAPLVFLRIYYDQNPFPIVLQALPIPSTILGPPKGYVFAKERYPQKYTSVIPAEKKSYPPFPFAKSQEATVCEYPEAFVVELDNARVYGKNGVVITDEDKVLADTAIAWISHIKEHKIFRKRKLPKVTYSDETIAVVASKSNECFFHWMFDILPKLEILKKSGIHYDKIYLNQLALPYQKESFAKLGLDEKKIIWADENKHILAKHLVVPSLPGGIYSRTPPWVCDYLHLLFCKNEVEGRGKRIYISRKGKRRLLNENELMATLTPLGFEKVELETLSVANQAELFASAEWIVAPHGAALTHLAFCKKGTKLIEIFSPNYLNACYWLLSHDRGLKHTCIMGTPQGDENDIRVDIEKVVAVINEK